MRVDCNACVSRHCFFGWRGCHVHIALFFLVSVLNASKQESKVITKLIISLQEKIQEKQCLIFMSHLLSNKTLFLKLRCYVTLPMKHDKRFSASQLTHVLVICVERRDINLCRKFRMYDWLFRLLLICLQSLRVCISDKQTAGCQMEMIQRLVSCSIASEHPW